MDSEVVTTSTGLAALGPEWDRLERAVADAGQTPGGTHYLKHHFVSAWWSSFRHEPGFELAVLVVRHNGAVVGIAPLATAPAQRGAQRVRRLRFATHGDYLGFLLDPAAPQDTVAKSLLEAMSSELVWDSARLGGMPVHAPLGRHLLRSDDYNPHFTLHVENPYIDLTAYPDFATFSTRQIPKHTRKQRRRLARERPDLQFRTFRGNDQDIFARIGEVHRAERDFLIEHLDRTERHSLFDDHARWGHYRQLFTGTDDCLTFALEAPDGELAGYRTTFRDDRRLLSWNSAYHPDYADYRIGTMLLHDMVEHLCETREFDVLDLGAGRYPWKFGWTPTFHATYRLQLEREQPPAAPAAPSRRAVRSAGDQTASAPPSDEPSPEKPTLFVISPHPDDETIRTTGFLTSPGAVAGRCVLVAVSDGGNSSLSRRRGWTPEQEQECRRAEQAAAWAALTGGRGEIVRLGLPDGAITPEAVTRALRRAVPGVLDPGVRVMVAAHADDYHPDHRAVVQAVRELAPEDLVLSLSPLMPDPADAAHLVLTTVPADDRRGAAQVARDAYAAFGQHSVKPEFAALTECGYASRLTTPDEPRRRGRGVHGSTPPRILVLGRQRDTLPGLDGPQELAGVEELRWAAGVPDGGVPDDTDLRVDPLTADPPSPASAAEATRRTIGAPVTAARGLVARWRGGARDVAQGDPDGRGAQPSWGEILRSSSRARLLLAQADVILSADADTDAALATLGSLLEGRQVVPSERSRGVLTALAQLDELATELTDDLASSLKAGDGFDARLGVWGTTAMAISAGLSQERGLLTPWAGLWTDLPAAYDAAQLASIRTRVLGALPWDPHGPGAALRAALRLSADLTLTTEQPRERTVAADVRTVVEHALAGATEAMRARRNQDALNHLTSALAALFHPALHRDPSQSPLRDDPSGFLTALWSASPFRTLVNRDKALSSRGAALQQPDREDDAARGTDPVLVVGAGAEAGDLRERLGVSAGVQTYDPARWLPHLAESDLDETVVGDLAGLIGSQHKSARFGRSAVSEAQRSAVWELAARLLAVTQVLVPRADPAAVWVSHLCPQDVRLVVRVGPEDTVRPWLQLVRWDRVTTVIVDDEEDAALVRTLLDGLGADRPVDVVPPGAHPGPPSSGLSRR